MLVGRVTMYMPTRLIATRVVPLEVMRPQGDMVIRPVEAVDAMANRLRSDGVLGEVAAIGPLMVKAIADSLAVIPDMVVVVAAAAAGTMAVGMVGAGVVGVKRSAGAPRITRQMDSNPPKFESAEVEAAEEQDGKTGRAGATIPGMIDLDRRGTASTKYSRPIAQAAHMAEYVVAEPVLSTVFADTTEHSLPAKPPSSPVSLAQVAALASASQSAYSRKQEQVDYTADSLVLGFVTGRVRTAGRMLNCLNTAGFARRSDSRGMSHHYARSAG